MRCARIAPHPSPNGLKLRHIWRRPAARHAGGVLANSQGLSAKRDTPGSARRPNDRPQRGRGPCGRRHKGSFVVAAPAPLTGVRYGLVVFPVVSRFALNHRLFAGAPPACMRRLRRLGGVPPPRVGRGKRGRCACAAYGVLTASSRRGWAGGSADLCATSASEVSSTLFNARAHRQCPGRRDAARPAVGGTLHAGGVLANSRWLKREARYHRKGDEITLHPGQGCWSRHDE